MRIFNAILLGINLVLCLTNIDKGNYLFAGFNLFVCLCLALALYIDKKE